MCVCGYRKMRVTRSIFFFFFLVERLQHTSKQKEKEADKEGWVRKKVMECGPEKKAREGRAWRRR